MRHIKGLALSGTAGGHLRDPASSVPVPFDRLGGHLSPTGAG